MVGKACRIRIDDTVFTFAHAMSKQRPSGNFHTTSIGISTGRFSYPDKISTQWRFANISRANVVGETNTFRSDASSRRDYQTSGVVRNARTTDWFNPERADTSRHRVLRSRGHVLFGEVRMHSLLAATSRIIDAKSPAIARRCPRPCRLSTEGRAVRGWRGARCRAGPSRARGESAPRFDSKADRLARLPAANLDERTSGCCRINPRCQRVYLAVHRTA